MESFPLRLRGLGSAVPIVLLGLLLGPLTPNPILAQEDEELGWLQGPGTPALGNQAEIQIPEGYLFAGAEATRQLMRQMGNPPSGKEMGLIAPEDDEEEWFVVFEYFPVGYVADDDQDEIDAEALLKGISEGTEAANDTRREMGFSPLHVVGWSEKPHYDPSSHNLVWALEAEDEEGGRVINHNIRLLGRQGYISATVVTGADRMARDKVAAEQILTGFHYQPGKRYAEFVDGDKLAGYGLTALVAGGAGAAAAKLGLFAKLGKLLARFWKLLAVGFAAGAAGLKRLATSLLGRRPKDAEVG